ncbi:dihydrofolate reductase-like domain-containing protein [Podospora fimiseda]|uniref:Dihydrofolate reductase n=1 Tax=Podospora fimiseda TaxID=252190 RepID=A0AAN7BYQ5_9PEZI|nr:dihydrofolate reductase-like domain-containing protein [Podospora fimiseda]
MPPQPDITLILAAAGQSLGIGRNGTLPWTGLKKEMAYFARVTKRVPPSFPSNKKNAVIMGRKTWQSIPAKFKPLPDRINVVISRSAQQIEGEKGEIWVESLTKAVEILRGERGEEVARIFVIGGGEIYREAMKGGFGARRILLTRVEGDFECDTFFEWEGRERWVKRGKEEMDRWVGEEVPGGRLEEGGVGYEFEMWERVD